MAKMKDTATATQDARPLGGERSWARTNGSYIAGRACVDGADETACEMESKWGVDRLRLLVSPELREKFDRQRYRFNQAISRGEFEDVRRESGRMVNAWMALDRAAEAAGASKLSPQVWEVALADGSVAAIVPDDNHAALVNAEGRQVAVYTLEEIGRLLSAHPHIVKAKKVFPGATVTAVRRSVEDPLNAVWDTEEPPDTRFR
jgi:hypothetical protein